MINMKSLVWLAGMWIAASILGALIADVWLTLRWRAAAESAFQRSIYASQIVLQHTDWELPLESDLRWQDMEQKLDLNIVPSPQDELRGSVPQVSWSRETSQGIRLSTYFTASMPRLSGQPNQNLPVMDALQRDGNPRIGAKSPIAYSFRVSRQLRPRSDRWQWFVLWAVSNLLGWAFTASVFRFQRQQVQAQQNLLQPWLESTQNLEGGQLEQPLLPSLHEDESQLVPALALVSQRVNDVVEELQSAKDRSQLVLGNLQEGVLAVDDRTRILLANAALRRQLDLGNDPFLYRPFLEIIRIPIVDQLLQAVLNEQVQREATFEFGQPVKSLRLLARPLPLGDRRQGALLTVRDESTLRRIESIRRDFVANASHELKTPLAAIRAYAETLQMGALDDRPTAEHFISNIISQADRIHALVQGMLQLSRVQAGTALHIEAFDTAQALKPCLSAAEVTARAKGISLQVDIADPLTLRSDRDGFQTIASNLLSNAVRYTPPGGQVSVATLAEGDWFVLRVSDTGIGMHQQDLDRVFERFYRAEKDRSVDTGGTGLGLSIVKNLVQALEGNVSAHSQPQAGSCFEVRLPLPGVGTAA